MQYSHTTATHFVCYNKSDNEILIPLGDFNSWFKPYDEFDGMGNNTTVSLEEFYENPQADVLREYLKSRS